MVRVRAPKDVNHTDVFYLSILRESEAPRYSQSFLLAWVEASDEMMTVVEQKRRASESSSCLEETRPKPEEVQECAKRPGLMEKSGKSSTST